MFMTLSIEVVSLL